MQRTAMQPNNNLTYNVHSVTDEEIWIGDAGKPEFRHKYKLKVSKTQQINLYAILHQWQIKLTTDSTLTNTVNGK